MGALWQNGNETTKDKIDRAKMRIYSCFGGKNAGETENWGVL